MVIKKDRTARRAFIVGEIEILPPYSADVDTTHRVAIVLRAHTGPWSNASQLGLEQTLWRSPQTAATFYRAKSRESAKLAHAFPEDSKTHFWMSVNGTSWSLMPKVIFRRAWSRATRPKIS